VPLNPNVLERLVLLRLNRGPAPVLDLFGAASFEVVSLAVDLGVFDSLEAGAATPAALADRLDADPDGLRALLGFLAAQPLAHALIKRPDGSIRGRLALFGAGLAVHLVIFAIGVPWLYLIRRLDDASQPLAWTDAIHYGFVVFIPGMLLKSGIAAGIAAWLLPHVARRLW